MSSLIRTFGFSKYSFVQEMSETKESVALQHTIAELSDFSSLDGLYHVCQNGRPLPSGPVLSEITDLCRAILFPGYYGRSNVSRQTLPYHIGVSVERLYELLTGQIEAAGGCGAGLDGGGIAMRFVGRLPDLRRVLATDVEAAFNGDPAAESLGEIISCYPVIKAVTNYRIAHELLLLGVPLIPRIITEMAHSETGIDIHPAATIGHHFTIDHGTGVVIGATCIIGNYVKLYQGVTLGAKSFPLDEKGHPIKGIPRHPILEDHVIVYSNATVLGRITIAKGTVIGGNVWVTESTKPGEQIVQARKRKGTVKETIINPQDWGGL